MPEVAECPQCHRQLRVPDDLIGQHVKCPACATTFTAGATPPPPAEAPPPAPIGFKVEEPGSAPPPPPRYEDEEERDVDLRRRQRRDVAPHRGTLILTLGILGLVLGCLPVGIFAWVMGNTDMAEIRAGRMDPQGEGTTNAGRICGIISTVYGGIWLCCCGLQILAGVANG
jgi:predicted Zn finger-like uncharacterized protein